MSMAPSIEHQSGPNSTTSGATSVMVPLDQIVMREEDRVRPVKKDEDHYKQVKYSMDTVGQLTPINVIPDDKEPGKLRVWSGHHRVTAAQELGWKEIEAKIGTIEPGEITVRQMQANFQKAMSPVEQARVLRQFLGRPENWGRTYTDVLVEAGFAATPSKAQWLLKQMGLTNLVPQARQMMEIAGTDRDGLPLTYAVTLAKFPHEGPLLETDDDGNVKVTGQSNLQADWLKRFQSYHDKQQWAREANQSLDQLKAWRKGQPIVKDQFSGTSRRKDSEVKAMILNLQKQAAEERPVALDDIDEADVELIRNHYLLEGVLWMMHMDPDSVEQRRQLAAMKQDQRDQALTAKKELAKAVNKINDPTKLEAMKKAYKDATGEDLPV